MLAILEVLRMCSVSFHESLIVESDSSNENAWILWNDNIPWKFQYFLNEIRSLSSLIQVVFNRINRSDSPPKGWREMLLLLTLDVLLFYFCFEGWGMNLLYLPFV